MEDSIETVRTSIVASPTGQALPTRLPIQFQLPSAPQDPFFPQEPLNGPTFLDTSACRCTLRTLKNDSVSQTAWRCQGNSTETAYTGTSGKWFPSRSLAEPGTEPDDDSNPPTLEDARVFSDSTGRLVRLGSPDQDQLSIYDQACSGVNDTAFTTALYRTAVEISNNETPVDGAPCLRPGAIPIQIQDGPSWHDQGCAKGFFCESHYVPS